MELLPHLTEEQAERALRVVERDVPGVQVKAADRDVLGTLSAEEVAAERRDFAAWADFVGRDAMRILDAEDAAAGTSWEDVP